MKTCPNCHAEMPDELSFCTSCGFKLNVEGKTCQRCGMVNPSVAAFCSGCGMPLGSPIQNQVPTIDPEEQRRQNSLDVIKNTLAGNPGQAELAGIISQLEALGGYKDAAMILADCKEKLSSIQYAEASEQFAKADEDKSLYFVLEKRFEKLGDYKDSKEKYDVCKSYCDAVRAKKRKKIAIISSSCVAAVIAAFLVIKVIIPMVSYNGAVEALGAGEYETAIERFAALGDYKDAPLLLQSAYYQHGVALFENEDYEAAVIAFTNAGEYEDAGEKIKSSHYEHGLALLKDGEFESAKGAFELANGFEKAKKYASYADGRQNLVNKNYEKAIKCFDECKDVEDGAKRYSEANYLFAEQNLSKSKYSDAKKYYNAAGTYEDAVNKAKICDLMLAEKEYSDGNLNAAKTALSNLPTDLSYNGVVAGDLLKQLNANSSFVNACGKWTASKNYIESRNIYKRNGSWDSWYIDNPITSQQITVRCLPNKDGTFTIKGNVEFYRFTDYSSLSSLCNATSTSRSFTISNVSKIPSSYTIDSDTTLKYSNGTFSISYSKKDNYSAYFYNKYNSSVTYGTRSQTY